MKAAISCLIWLSLMSCGLPDAETAQEERRMQAELRDKQIRRVCADLVDEYSNIDVWACQYRLSFGRDDLPVRGYE